MVHLWSILMVLTCVVTAGAQIFPKRFHCRKKTEKKETEHGTEPCACCCIYCSYYVLFWLCVPHPPSFYTDI